MPESPGQNLPPHNVFKRDLHLSRETDPFFKDSAHKHKHCSKFGLPTTVGFPGVSVHTQRNLKSICLQGFLQLKGVWV